METKEITRPRAKTGRRESTEQRRREILDAALQCFLANGVNGTTIEQICAASKASHGSVYHLFGSKDEIALTLFAEGMQNYHERVLAAVENENTARGKIRAIIATHLADVVREPQLAIYMTRLGMADAIGEISHQCQAANAGFARAIEEDLKPFVAQGEIKQLPKELYHSIISGPATHLSRSWLSGRVDCDLLAATDDLVEAAWQSLQANRSEGETID